MPQGSQCGFRPQGGSGQGRGPEGFFLWPGASPEWGEVGTQEEKQMVRLLRAPSAPCELLALWPIPEGGAAPLSQGGTDLARSPGLQPI